jgi:hypothetical protein
MQIENALDARTRCHGKFHWKSGSEMPGLVMGKEVGNETLRVGTAGFLCGIGTSAMNDTAVVQEHIRSL